jgi:hypothetical protein
VLLLDCAAQFRPPLSSSSSMHFSLLLIIPSSFTPTPHQCYLHDYQRRLGLQYIPHPRSAFIRYLQPYISYCRRCPRKIYIITYIHTKYQGKFAAAKGLSFALSLHINMSSLCSVMLYPLMHNMIPDKACFSVKGYLVQTRADAEGHGPLPQWWNDHELLKACRPGVQSQLALVRTYVFLFLHEMK